MLEPCELCIDQKGRKKLDRARGPMKHLKVDKQIDCCYLCYWFKEDDGELTLIEGIDTCVLCNPERKPELIRIIDWVD